MWHDVDGMGWWMVAGSVWMLFFVVALVWLVTRLASGPPEPHASALDIAKARYARGEISSQELAELRRHLED